MNILAACSGPDSPVRKVVFKSSTHYYGSEQDDPAFFDETMSRPHPPRTPIERDIVEAEASLGEFAERNPDVAVTVLRFANVLGPDVRTSHIDLFSLPAVPMILGFDPRYQFVHEDDVVHALEHAVQHRAAGRLQRRRRRRAGAERGGRAARQAATRRCCRPGARGSRPAVLRRAGRADPARGDEPAALRARGRQPALQGRRLPLPAHEPRDRAQAGRAPAPAPGAARRAGALPLRARGGGVPALEPARQSARRQARRQRSAATRSPSSSGCSTSIVDEEDGAPSERGPARGGRGALLAAEQTAGQGRRARQEGGAPGRGGCPQGHRAREEGRAPCPPGRRGRGRARRPGGAAAGRAEDAARRARSSTTTISRPRR